VLDETAFPALAKRTADWCESHSGLLHSTAYDLAASDDIFQTRVAFETRRQASQPFGRYEFAFAEPPAQPVQLPCKEWERAWSHPASVWLQRIVGVSAWPKGELAWARAVGAPMADLRVA
jgi:exonuclease V gamma subunit